MTLHPKAETLSLLLIAERAQPGRDVEYAAYRVINAYMGGEPEAKLADLYAKIAEQYDPKSTLGTQQALLSRLLWANENWWATC